MQPLDYLVIAIFFLVIAGIGVAAFRKVKGSGDYFVAGGKIPWWLGGVSHHVSGHSGVVFVAYAAVAYEYGFTLYVWWALTIVLACTFGALVFAPRWARLRRTLAIESPTEYLAMRYNVATQQIMAVSGVLLKLFDVGAKWAAIGILLHGFTGLPVAGGVLVAGGISLCYVTIGGLWADLYTDFAQFVVQVVAGLVLFVAVVKNLGGIDSLWTLWDRLPADHGHVFNGPYTPVFLVGYAAAVMLSYNGGTWNLAIRYIGAPSASHARRTAILSGSLYLLWPLVLFFPMWAAPLILPNLADPAQSYVLLTRKLMPTGLVGLVLASMFAATMSMTSSDTNTISSVITRDILPVWFKRFRQRDQRATLRVARFSTLCFMLGTLVIGIEADRFGGVLGLIITWFAALVGPVAVPMLFGLLPIYQRADARAAISSIAAGLTGFVVVTYGVHDASMGARVLTPIACSLVTFSFLTWLVRHRPVPAAVAQLMRGLATDSPADATAPATDASAGDPLIPPPPCPATGFDQAS